jgi:YgiT-type zinc finger domain-containing protein
MSKKFDPCEYCGKAVKSRRVTVDLRREGQLYTFQNVPVGVCSGCGERYYPGTTLEQLTELAEHGLEGARTVRVPTVDFSTIDQ